MKSKNKQTGLPLLPSQQKASQFAVPFFMPDAVETAETAETAETVGQRARYQCHRYHHEQYPDRGILT